jgi:hypothetical protein
MANRAPAFDRMLDMPGVKNSKIIAPATVSPDKMVCFRGSWVVMYFFV